MSRAPITPYWHRLPAFFRFPLRRPALDLLGLTVLLGVVPLLLGVGLLMFFSTLAMIFILMKYGYETLQSTASGEEEPLPLREALSGEGYALPLKQLAVIICLFVLAGLAGLVSPFLMGLLLVLVALLLPASVIILGTERSFFAAVNPLNLFSVAARIGWAYFGLVGLLLCIQIATASASQVVEFLLPAGANPYLNYSGMIFVGNYFTLMTFHLLGYVVYQYHEALDHPVFHPEDHEPDELALFEELLEAGNHQAALTELRSVMARNPERKDLKEKLVRLARLTGDAETLRREGPEAIAALVRAGRRREATDVYLDCRQADEAFRPQAPEVHDVIAMELRSRGQIREALALLNGFHQRFPEHPLVPRAYVLAARIFLDDVNKPDQARKLLGYLQRHYADSPYASEVDSLQRSLA